MTNIELFAANGELNWAALAKLRLSEMSDAMLVRARDKFTEYLVYNSRSDDGERDARWFEIFSNELERRNNHHHLQEARAEARGAQRTATQALWITAGVGILQVLVGIAQIICAK